VDLFVPEGQQSVQSCSAHDLVTFVVFEKSLFVRGPGEERHQRCLKRLHFVGTQVQVVGHNLRLWVHSGAPLACYTPPYSAKRWRSFVEVLMLK
jgi:hypothetical protein